MPPNTRANADRLARENCRPELGMEFKAGKDSYALRGRIGDGAVGLVRRAVNVEDGSEVAVKFLAPDPKYIEPANFGDVAERFRREGTRGANLRHENLVTVKRYIENTDGEAFVDGTIKNP